MSADTYDTVFVGGGLAAALLARKLRGALGGRVAILDPLPPGEREPVHWSYWSREQTFFDRFAVGAWRRARVGQAPPESISPYTLRLVLSTDVLESLLEESSKPAGIRWLRASARSIRHRKDGLYEVSTDAGTVYGRRIFDSACEVPPVFPEPRRPQAVLSGTGLRVTADRPIFDVETANLLDPLDERSFAYLLPLSPVEALLESASFGPAAQREAKGPLLDYLRARHPGADFDIGHAEHGVIPLGFAPARTTGPRHVLIGAKRGLVKPSAGYGVIRIARESDYLARQVREDRLLPQVRRSPLPWRLADEGFLRLAAHDPARPLALLERVMHAVPLSDSLGFIDEELSLRQLANVFRAALPALLRGL